MVKPMRMPSHGSKVLCLRMSRSQRMNHFRPGTAPHDPKAATLTLPNRAAKFPASSTYLHRARFLMPGLDFEPSSMLHLHTAKPNYVLR